jgi:transposase
MFDLLLISENFTHLGYIRRMKYTMNKKELARLTVIKGAINGAYTVKQAARKLGISGRQVQYLKKAVREQGEASVIHGNAEKPPANYTDEQLRQRIIALKQSAAYEQTNFTHFRELLEGMRVSYATLCRMLKASGIASKRKHRDGANGFPGGKDAAASESYREPTLRVLTGSATENGVPSTALLMTPRGKSSPCICAGTNVFRGIWNCCGRL